MYRKSIFKQMQYRFAVNFGTLNISTGCRMYCGTGYADINWSHNEIKTYFTYIHKLWETKLRVGLIRFFFFLGVRSGSTFLNQSQSGSAPLQIRVFPSFSGYAFIYLEIETIHRKAVFRFISLTILQPGPTLVVYAGEVAKGLYPTLWKWVKFRPSPLFVPW